VKNTRWNPACLDCAKHQNEEKLFIVYRYGEIMLKQVGMAMIGM
jgi:hypothetical protein